MESAVEEEGIEAKFDDLELVVIVDIEFRLWVKVVVFVEAVFELFLVIPFKFSISNSINSSESLFSFILDLLKTHLYKRTLTFFS